MITDRDISIRATSKGLNPQSTTVKQVMTPHCLYCFEEDSVEDVARNMGKNQIRRLPVMNKDKRLVGFVSLGDLSCKGCKEIAGEALATISHK